VERYKRELAQEIPEVDLFLGFSDLHHLVPALPERGLIDDPVAVHPGVRQFLGDQVHVRYLKISEGCDHTCAFCAIPLMRGKHRWDPLERLVRDTIPDLAIRTTCLLGFPGETDEDFGQLLEFLEEAQFDRLGAFAYSPQEGTRGAAYPDDVPEGVKRDRLEEVLEVQRAISAERLARFVGRDVSVLVDRVADPDDAAGSTHVGRVPWQADGVDGVTYLAEVGWAR